MLSQCQCVKCLFKNPSVEQLSLTIGLIAVSKSATEPTLYQYPNHFHFPSEEEIKFFNFPAPAFVCQGAKVTLNEEH